MKGEGIDVSDKPAIGFIGVGYMGHGMAANILKGGYDLRVKGNRNRAPVDDLVSRGAVEAASPRAMAEAWVRAAQGDKTWNTGRFDFPARPEAPTKRWGSRAKRGAWRR